MGVTILWRRLDLPGHEISRLEPRDAGWELGGTALFSQDGHACRLDYQVLCDESWNTVSARVTGFLEEREVDLRITVDRDRNWSVDGEASLSVAGCVDIDLAFTPSTNLLPIRRLALGVGESAEVTAAWLPFPTLALEPLEQVYRREAETTYRYESGGGSFERTLEVDGSGFVIDYPGLWRREGS